MKEDIQILLIDLFCGAGGVTTGAEKAMINKVKVCKTIACVNHDKNAIQSHAANHAGVYHFTEDIRTMNLTKLVEIVAHYRKLYPNSKLLLWASLECTNFSKAKGGLPREADSRTLADSLFRYIEAVHPDLIFIENVEEFMSWGPLDANGKPESKTAGKDYIRWINKVQSYGYDFDYRIFNTADFGAYTSRKRFFGQFVKYGLPIAWPSPTHSKTAKNDMFGNFEKWRPVRDVLDLMDEGNSIFTRKNQLVENTLERIYYGLIKFVSKGESTFIQKHFSGKPHQKVVSINEPAPTITTVANQSIITAKFLQSYYGNGGVHSIDDPCPTVSTHDRFSKITCQFLDKQYGSGKYNNQDILSPARTLTSNPKLNLITANWLVDTQYNNIGKSIDEPCPTIIARQDKKPIYLVSAISGNNPIEINENDTSYMVKIKKLCIEHGIIDIKMRMLNIKELKLITGFPENYVLLGTQADQKKFIGNAVPVIMSQKLIEAYAEKVMQIQMKEVA